MAETTEHTVIYRTVFVHDVLEPIVCTGWVTVHHADDDLEDVIAEHSITLWLETRPECNREDVRLIEITWSDMGPVEVPDVPHASSAESSEGDI